jgi:hypothetical protein
MYVWLVLPSKPIMCNYIIILESNVNLSDIGDCMKSNILQEKVEKLLWV